MRYFKKIEGERLYLSPINIGDAVLYTKWLNDPAVSLTVGNYNKLISLEAERGFLDRMTAAGYNFAMVLKGENTPEGEDILLGNISLMDIDQVSRKATVGLFIGEAAHRGKGYGAEALRLILEYGFRTLNLHNIMLLCHSDNAPGIACYKKVGFREFGRRRDATFKSGKYVDVVYMEILDSEFSK